MAVISIEGRRWVVYGVPTGPPDLVQKQGTHAYDVIVIQGEPRDLVQVSLQFGSGQQAGPGASKAPARSSRVVGKNLNTITWSLQAHVVAGMEGEKDEEGHPITWSLQAHVVAGKEGEKDEEGHPPESPCPSQQRADALDWSPQAQQKRAPIADMGTAGTSRRSHDLQEQRPKQ
jgi:hypothetical protein